MIDEELMHEETEGNDETPKDLAFNEEKGSYELDVEDNDQEWDHPADYSTISLGADEDTSNYDTANPFVGSEYSDLEELREEEFAKANMRIASEKELKTSRLDKKLSNDERDGDIFEEGEM